MCCFSIHEIEKLGLCSISLLHGCTILVLVRIWIDCPVLRCLQSVSISNIEGNTPLHWACLNGKIDAVRLLLEAGAVATALNSHDNTPMDEALLRNFDDIVALINQYNAPTKVIGEVDDFTEDSNDVAEADAD